MNTPLISITRSGYDISVASPFHPAFVSRAKELGGKWDAAAKVWTFDARDCDEDDVRALCRAVYGTDGSSDTKLVDLRITFKSGARAGQRAVYVCGREIARAWGRDSGAKLGEGVKLVEGRITSGGSSKNWATVVDAGSVFIVRDVPEAKARAEAEACNTDEFSIEILTSAPAAVDVSALQAEREKLVARMAEIDAILSTQTATAA